MSSLETPRRRYRTWAKTTQTGALYYKYDTWDNVMASLETPRRRYRTWAKTAQTDAFVLHISYLG